MTIRNKKAKKNPFADYQKQRQQESIVKVKAAVDNIVNLKGRISYNAVARLSGMTISGIKRNKECVMVIEQAKARQCGSNLPSADSSNTMPKTVDDAVSIIRLQRVEIRELRNKLSIYEKAVKRYNLTKSFGDEFVIEPAGLMENQTVDALKRVIQAILDDRVYTMTPEGIRDSLNKVVVNRHLLTAAGLPEILED